MKSLPVDSQRVTADFQRGWTAALADLDQRLDFLWERARSGMLTEEDLERAVVGLPLRVQVAADVSARRLFEVLHGRLVPSLGGEHDAA